MALSQYRATLHSCGHALEESTDPQSEGRYVVPPPTRCHACDALSARQAEYQQQDVKRPEALLWRAELRR